MRMQYILSLSYGKDSMACLGAIEQLGMPLDRIITADVWATDTISADLPEMHEFKSYADQIIKERYGITVEHVSAGKTFEDYFYKFSNGKKSKYAGHIYGFPIKRGMWCNSKLKVCALKNAEKLFGKDYVSYQGIAIDEPERLERLHKRDKAVSPLELIGWTEADCRKWCEENGLLSPVYKTGYRDGCWFCPLQGIDSLRRLRKKHPDLWDLLLKWDADSPTTFKADGHTAHDYDERFAMEDDGLIDPGARFRWTMLDYVQLRLF